jgi:hypothetical protein
LTYISETIIIVKVLYDRMASVARKFWFTIAPSLAALSATGLLILAALFPEPLFAVGSTGYITTAAVALVSVGVVVWQLTVGIGTQDTIEAPDQRRNR